MIVKEWKQQIKNKSLTNAGTSMKDISVVLFTTKNWNGKGIENYIQRPKTFCMRENNERNNWYNN